MLLKQLKKTLQEKTESIQAAFLERTESTSNKAVELWSDFNFDGPYSHSESWEGIDSEANYALRGNKKYETTPISYDYNCFGFRINSRSEETESSDTKIIACFGCSQTFGAGLPYEETWPYLLQKKLQNKVQIKNYGKSGCAADTIVRLIHNYLENNTPYAICCLLPDMFRRELFEYYGKDIRTFNLLEGKELKGMDLKQKCGAKGYNYLDYQAYHRLSGEDNCMYQYIKNIKMIESLCKARGVKIVIGTWSIEILEKILKGQLQSSSLIDPSKPKYKPLFHWGALEKARDGIHLGLQACALYADLFADVLTTFLI